MTAGGFLLSLLLALAAPAADGKELVGRTAPEWEVSNWINSDSVRLSDLRGKVVLVRWWTAPDCPFCAASAPALNEFFNAYQDRGLVVLGFYHHKSAAPLDAEHVRKYAAAFGFRFPVAIDIEWKTLRRWWLSGGSRGWTSVSFLIDRDGVIRYVHPGGSYAPGTPDYEEFKRAIENVLD